LVDAGPFTYRAVDSRSGLVEHEQDHVFVALADTSMARAHPEEIGELSVRSFADALRLAESAAGAPWAAEVLRRSFAALNGRRPNEPDARPQWTDRQL
jgi:isopentenyldiphosphate isomerase